MEKATVNYLLLFSDVRLFVRLVFERVTCIQGSKGVDEAFLGKLEVFSW